MNRRKFLKQSVFCGVAAVLPKYPLQALTLTPPIILPLFRKLPPWHGFNLMEKQDIERWGKYTPYREEDFEMIAEWGFNLARLPLDYRCWTDANEPRHLDEKAIGQIDQAVEWGRQYGVHVSLNMYCAPGYRIGQELTPSLWLDANQAKLFSFYWSHFAERYKDIPSERLSFHLINEPGKVLPKSNPNLKVDAQMYLKVVDQAVNTIRQKDPQRLIITDGLRWSLEPVPELVDLKIAQSTHWFDPKGLVFYKAPWLSEKMVKKQPKPNWPLRVNGQLYDKQWLYRQRIQPWKNLEKMGVGVQISAWGIMNTVPHEIALKWMRDSLDLFKKAGWGWALWNFRDEHGFGPVDGHRKDITYESFKGHKIDRRMLELLRQFGQANS